MGCGARARRAAQAGRFAPMGLLSTEKFLELLGAAQGDAGVSNETLQRKFPGESYAALLPVINELLAENRLELLKEEGKQDLTYRLRDKAQAEKLSELTNEQLLVLQQQTLNKALKVLESRKLVKTVKSVQQKTKKLYMAYDLVPTREVSGGPWYTDQEFDHEFVGAIKKIVVKYVQSVQTSTLDEIHGALERSGIATVPLSVADVKLVIDTLLCDSKLEEFTAVTAASGEQDDDDELGTGVRRSPYERRALEVTVDYTAWLPYRVRPPREASNEDLAALKPLYVELLREPARKFDEVLDGPCDGPCAADDGRAVLLYALEYAMMRAARTEVGGLGVENFPLHVPCKRIATDGRLLRWCRDALRASRDRRAALIMSCVGLLRQSGSFLKKPRAVVENFLGAGGLEALWDDCASCLRRYDARAGRLAAFPANATVEIMLLCIEVDTIVVSRVEFEGIVPERHREFFASALEHARPKLDVDDALVREHGCDYVLDVDAEKYFKVEFENPMASVFFRTLRVKAKGGCRRSLYMMYDQLCGLSPELTQQVRRQLRGEYGVDPQACKDAPVTASISAADIRAATGGEDETQRAAYAEQLSRAAETDPEVRGALAAAGHRLPPPRYSAATEAFARSRGVPDTEEGSAAHLFEIIMTERLERMVLLFRDQPHGDDAFDPYDVELWTSNCGGDADMARRVVAEARARVLRHDREGTNP
ncbi:hypothetical protein JL721_7083 [Aureococcus anophagefferens]|nr:hypothetical protein JL721_7083 [Aureococcus anophagefferens]